MVKSRNSIGRDCNSVNRTPAMGRASCHCLVISEAHHTRKKAGQTQLLPACHREDVWLLALLHPQVLSTHQIERRQRGVEMKISGGGGACLTVQQAGELF